ncbi:MAG: glycosyltransferase family 4 protein [Alphaproteobacteria bacterium]|nr:glycosyltransferase family 4 protein [Alphaproteobacteria bacterium]
MPAQAPQSRAVAVVLKGYPRLSETFIAQELLALQRRGLPMVLVSLRHPTDRHTHPIHSQITAPVRYLPEYLYQEPVRVWRAWRRARRLPGYPRALAQWWRDLRRDRTPNRIRRFGQALVLAAELPDLRPQGRPVGHLYAHFLHTPGSVARYASLITGLPWSVSAHAKDIWTIPSWEKREKLAAADWCVTCTRVGWQHLRSLAPPERADDVRLLYHGLDFSRFSPYERPLSTADGSSAQRCVVLLSIGRTVQKKGYDDLLQALSELSPGLHWRLEHIGGGPFSRQLAERARELGMSDRIVWHGAQPADQVLAAHRRADLFVLAAKPGPDGDVDGLPNVLMEAQSQSLCCLATTAGGIPELIENGQTGVLVSPSSPTQLARALGDLITDPAARARLGQAGAHRVHAEFSAERSQHDLAALFGMGDGEASAQPIQRAG